MTHSIISLGQRAAPSALLLRASCPEEQLVRLNVTRAGNCSGSPIADRLTVHLRQYDIGLPYSPSYPRSGESSGGGLAPHHWHFSHPAFVMAGLRITEVPFVKYRTIELFCFQGADFYRKSSEFRASEKLSL